MKFCTHCGAEIPDDSRFCSQCGGAAEMQPQPPVYQVAQPSTLLTVAKVLMIISCVITGFYLIPLCWTVPMTVSFCRSLKNGTYVGVGFKVCTLLFVNTVSGILMLIDGND